MRSPEGASDYRQSLEDLISERLGGVHTACIARVERYDPVLQQVDVKPLVKRRRYDEEDNPVDEPYKPIVNVPLEFPGNDECDIVWPVKIGDLVVLRFSHDSLDDVLELGQERPPSELRRHGLSDAIAFAGIRPFGAPRPAAPTDAIAIRWKGGVSVLVKRTGVEIAGAEHKPVLEQPLTTFLQQLLTYLGTLTTATGPVTSPQPPPTVPANLGSSKVRVGA